MLDINADGTAVAEVYSDTVTVVVPIQLRRRGARKSIRAGVHRVAQSRRTAPTMTPLLKAIARAFRWRRVIEAGVFSTIRDLATAEKVDPGYCSRIVGLTMLAPDLVELVLGDPAIIEIDLAMLMDGLPADWDAQRQLFHS